MFSPLDPLQNIWMYFADSCTAHQILLPLGFVKGHSDSSCIGEDLSNLIQKFCKCGEELRVEDHDLKVSIEEKLVSIMFSCLFGFLS